jgi:hypothetical protein
MSRIVMRLLDSQAFVDVPNDWVRHLDPWAGFALAYPTWMVVAHVASEAPLRPSGRF